MSLLFNLNIFPIMSLTDFLPFPSPSPVLRQSTLESTLLTSAMLYHKTIIAICKKVQCSGAKRGIFLFIKYFTIPKYDIKETLFVSFVNNFIVPFPYNHYRSNTCAMQVFINKNGQKWQYLMISKEVRPDFGNLDYSCYCTMVV